MRERTADIFYGICISAGGMCIALLYPVDIVILSVLIIAVIASVWFGRKLSFDLSSKSAKLLCFGALVSASVSVFLGVTLASDFALDKTFIPMLMLISCGAAVALAYSTARASKAVAFVMSLICVLLFAIIFLLCAVESDFTNDFYLSADKKILLPLVVFSVLDAFYIMPLVRKKNRTVYMISLSFMPIYMIATVCLAVSSFSAKVYSSFATPVIKMWQTCYVLSFVDRFETLIICVLFAICTVKAGMLLKTVFDNCSKKLLLLFVLLPIPLFFSESLLYVYAIISLLSAIVYGFIKKIC